MLCGYPITHDGRQFPCRQCMPCRINKKREWVGRLALEMSHTPRGQTGFVTLTYSPEYLPESDRFPDGNLNPRDLTLFLKRLRKRVGSFRYFAVGEYGDTKNRAHYHLLTFGLGPKFHPIIHDAWGLGRTELTEAGPHAASYVAGYVTKKWTKVNSYNEDDLGGRHPEFTRFSTRPRLGYAGFVQMGNALATRWGAQNLARFGMPKTYRVGSHMYAMPRWGFDMICERLGHAYDADDLWQLQDKWPQDGPWAFDLLACKIALREPDASGGKLRAALASAYAEIEKNWHVQEAEKRDLAAKRVRAQARAARANRKF